MLCVRKLHWTCFSLIARGIYQPDSIKVKIQSQCSIPTLGSAGGLCRCKPVHCWSSSYSAGTKSFSEAHLQNLQSVATTALLSQAHIKRLAAKLCCSVAEIKSLIGDHAFLIHMDLMLIESKVNLLLSYDLPLNFVKNNLRIVYQASVGVLEERLKLLQDCKLLHSNHLEINKVAHLLECNSFVFRKSLTYHCDQRDALEGCRDQLAYLQMRLGCTEKKAGAMLNSYPLERHISNVKLKAQLDFFLNEAERSPDFIIVHRKLLCFSVSRLRHRWFVMQRAGLVSEAQMVYVWSLPQREFEKQYSEHIEFVKSSSPVLN